MLLQNAGLVPRASLVLRTRLEVSENEEWTVPCCCLQVAVSTRTVRRHNETHFSFPSQVMFPYLESLQGPSAFA